MNASKLIGLIADGGLDSRFAEIYGEAGIAEASKRYTDVLNSFVSMYGSDRDVSLFSVPGRTEISGNHTDHNHGKVIAGSVSLDIIAAAAPSAGSVIRVKSEGFPEDIVDFSDYSEPDESLFGKSASLIAGCVKGISDKGFSVGGFDACTSSNVLKGSGLSSSAAFEDMIGTVLNHMYNGGVIDFVEISKISQFSENVFFGKPCGLMDQVACAAGGMVSIDFLDPKRPEVERLGFDLTKAGYNLVIINTGGNHADLTPDYAAVPAEMKKAAASFDEEVLRDVNEDIFVSRISEVRAEAGDRAVLRALHFFSENKRVDAMKNALNDGDIGVFLDLIKESGRSSFCYLQNVFTPSNVSEQGVSLALCLLERVLSHTARPSAWRVHGGGFAGTVQAFVPSENVAELKETISAVFGEKAVYLLTVRAVGACRVF
ncbi:MAG: galactokinase [Clostridia bacterium]|nr:galactokinase [Clostridia bacterium]